MKNRNTNKKPSDSENREHKPKCIYCKSDNNKKEDLGKQKIGVKFKDIFVKIVKNLLLLMMVFIE